jgi:hypothetical protein
LNKTNFANLGTTTEQLMISRVYRRILAAASAALCLGLAASAQGGTATLTIDVQGCANPTATASGGVITITGCDTGGSPGTPTVPLGCAITASPSSLPPGGGTVSLTMSCSSGSPTSYSWTGGVSGSTPTVSTNITSTTTFTAVASNAVGPSATASKTVTVGLPTGGGGGGGAISCDGFSGTQVIDFTWGSIVGSKRIAASALGANDALVARFTTGPTVADNQLGYISGGEYLGAPANRVAVLSATPCDFTIGLGTGSKKTSQTFMIRYYVGAGSSSFYPKLAPNTTYYLNVKTTDCAAGTSCNMALELAKPAGL